MDGPFDGGEIVKMFILLRDFLKKLPGSEVNLIGCKGNRVPDLCKFQMYGGYFLLNVAGERSKRVLIILREEAGYLLCESR